MTWYKQSLDGRFSWKRSPARRMKSTYQMGEVSTDHDLRKSPSRETNIVLDGELENLLESIYRVLTTYWVPLEVANVVISG